MRIGSGAVVDFLSGLILLFLDAPLLLLGGIRIAHRRLVHAVGFPHQFEIVIRPLIIARFDIEEREQEPRPHIVRMLGDDTGELMNRRVVIAVFRRLKRHIVALNHLRERSELPAAPSDIVEIKDRAVVFGPEVNADDPLHERIADLSHLIENESQEISGIRQIFVELQGAL